MKGKYLLFLTFYSAGWLYYLLGAQNSVFFVLGLFLIINVGTILRPDFYHDAILRPIQFSVTSASLLYLFEGEFLFATFGLVVVGVLCLLERENVDSIVKRKGFEKNRIILSFLRVVVSLILPFAVVYTVLLLRIDDVVASSVIVLIYFTVLFIAARWYDSIVSFSLFTISQMFMFVYVSEMYLEWSSAEITAFFVSILSFLWIGHGRKGLLTNSSN